MSDYPAGSVRAERAELKAKALRLLARGDRDGSAEAEAAADRLLIAAVEEADGRRKKGRA